MGKSVKSERLPAQKDPFAAGTLVLADQLRRDVSGQWTANRLEQSTHYRSVIYVAIRAIMDALLASTIQLNKKHRRYRQVSLRRQEKAMPTPHAHTEDEQFRPFDDPDHSLVKLIDQPNRSETFNEILSQIVLQYMLTGSGLLWANPNKMGLPAELYVLPTGLCYAQPPNPSFPEGWWRVQQYYPAGGYGILPAPMSGGGAPVDARDVFVFKNPHPLWRWDAMSPLTAGGVQLDILESIDQARWTAMDQGLTPDMVLLAPGVSQAQLDVYLERLRQTNIGKRNHRKVMAVGGDQGDSKFDVKFPSQSAKDMDFAAGWDQMTAFALALFGVPKSVAGLATTGSYAELYAALKQFHTLTLRPLVARMGVWLTRHLARIWGKDLAIQLDLPTIDDQQLQEQQLSTDLQHDGLTYNEYRAMRGREPVPGGEALVSVYVANQQAKAQQAQQAANPQPQPGAAPAQPGAPAPDQQQQPQPAAQSDQAQPEGTGSDADPLAALLGTGAPGSDDEHVQNAATDAALAGLGVPAQPSSPNVQKDYEPAHLKGTPKVPGKPLTPKIAAPAGKPTRTPSASDQPKTVLTNREPGDEYAGPTGKVFKQTLNDEAAPKGNNTNAVEPPKPAEPKLLPPTKPGVRPRAEDQSAPPAEPAYAGAPARPRGTEELDVPNSPTPPRLSQLPNRPGAPAAATFGAPDSGPAQPRKEGETWQGPSGHWFSLRNSKPVPVAAPLTAQPGVAPNAAAKAALAASTLPPGMDHDAAAKAVLSGNNFVRLGLPDGSQHEVRTGADLKEFFDRGGTLTQDEQMRVKLAAGAVKPVAPPEELKRTVQAGQLPPAESFANAARAVPASTPEAQKVLTNVNAWAANHADKHADRVAAHFGISREQAVKVLTHAITAVAQHATKTGGRGASGVLRDVNGQDLRVTLPGADGSNPRTAGARQVAGEHTDHLRSGHDLNPKHAAELAQALDHLPIEEVKQLDNSLSLSRTVSEQRTLNRLLSHAKQAVAAGVAAGTATGDALGGESSTAPADGGPVPAMTATAPAAPVPGRELEPPVGEGGDPTGAARTPIGGQQPASPSSPNATAELLDQLDKALPTPRSAAPVRPPVPSAPTTIEGYEPPKPKGEQPPAPAVDTPASRLADDLVERWGNFKSGKSAPGPTHQLDDKEYSSWESRQRSLAPGQHIDSPDDAHNLAAVIAGRKHAAWISAPFAQGHPLGKELIRRAEDAGMVVRPGPTEDGVPSMIVGRPDSVNRVVNGIKSGSHKEIGLGLGYHPRAVSDFVSKYGSHMRPKDTPQEGSAAPAALPHEEWFDNLRPHQQAAIERQADKVRRGGKPSPPAFVTKETLPLFNAHMEDALASVPQPKPKSGLDRTVDALGALGGRGHILDRVARAARALREQHRAPADLSSPNAPRTGSPDIGSDAPSGAAIESGELGPHLHQDVQVRTVNGKPWVVKGRNGKRSLGAGSNQEKP